MTCIPVDNKFNFISHCVPSWTEYCYNDCSNYAFPMYVFVRFFVKEKSQYQHTHVANMNKKQRVKNIKLNIMKI